MIKKFFLCTLIFFITYSFSQTGTSYTWFNPIDAKYPVINGRYWQTNLQQPYDRLAVKAEQSVRKEVWDLSHNSAGEYISFTTNANDIFIKLQVNGNYILPNMAAIGVSGVDLYMLDNNNNWHWASAQYSFGDTISFHFKNITASEPVKEYRLYLPLYKTPSWLLIGIDSTKEIAFQKVDDAKKPIVLYGTSILQGASASRPGLAWSNILGRTLDIPIINLGFSGNGQLETPLIDLINEIDALVYVLDCLPNLYNPTIFSKDEVEKRIINAAKSLQQKHPTTPIILCEHADGLPDINLDTSVSNKYVNVSTILSTTFSAMKKDGVKNIYLLTAKEIAFTHESTIDGTHPNDIGIIQYAKAYEKIIRKVLSMKQSY